MSLPQHGIELPGVLDLPRGPRALLVMARGICGTTTDARTRRFSESLCREGIGTLRIELVDEVEVVDQLVLYDIDLLAERLYGAVCWLGHRSPTAGVPVAVLGAGTAAAAALRCAARPDARVAAVVCHGGRPDLAEESLDYVRVPVLLLARTPDRRTTAILRATRARLRTTSDLILVQHSGDPLQEERETALTARAIAGWLIPKARAARIRRSCDVSMPRAAGTQD
ncbi:MAG TPA: hypothetical protein VFN97_14960 [Actinospica sp.]|nr:hypothetical protein [Actinospica sp.]